MTAYLDDLLAQPAAISATAEALLDDAVLLRSLEGLRGRFDAAVLTGMGTSHSALYPLHLRLIAAGIPAVWIETSELLHYGADGLGGRTLLVIVSQSGETVEVVRLLERAVGRLPIVGVTNDPNSTLARQADVSVTMRAGQEGIVATRTYVASLATLAVVGDVFAGHAGRQPARHLLATSAAALGDLLARRDSITRTLIEVIGNRPEQLFTIGRGPSFASAMGGALILKEASHTAAEPLSGGHFRHGPLEMVSERTAALVFSPAGRTLGITRRLAAEISTYGGGVVLVGPHDPTQPGAHLPLVETPPLDEGAAPLVEIAAAELLVIPLAAASGHEPGEFRRMGKITREE